MPRLAKIERKIEYFPIIGGEIKATNDAKGIVEGYLNYIGNIDYGDDRTMPGAFRKTLTDSYSRKTAQGLDFLWPYLWNHDYSQLPPGGIFEANEDRRGLYTKTQLNMDIQMGRELYASFKAGTLKKQSMGYKAIQVDWVKEGGKSIRNLLEVAVMEGSAVVFPMNDMAQVDTVKNRSYFFMESKTVCGDTSLPIGARDASWDGAAAHKQFVAWAVDSDGNVDAAKMKQVHLQCDGDSSKITSYHYPFCNIVSGKPQINVGGVKAAAGALSGARGASPGSDGAGMRRKVETLYGRINKKYPDATPLVAKWGKGNTVDIHSKDYAESLMMTNQQDWISDLWNLWYPLRNEILTAFQTGDTIEADVQAALAQFAPAVLAYVQHGIELNMTDCMQPADDGDSGGSMPMMMSADDNPETKDVKLLSASAHASMMKAVSGMEGHLKEMKSQLSRQRANALQGYQVYTAPTDELEQKDDEPEEEEELDEAAMLNKLRASVDDLATTLQFSNASKGF
jgi:HK97 family phage prohead protease